MLDIFIGRPEPEESGLLQRNRWQCAECYTGVAFKDHCPGRRGKEDLNTILGGNDLTTEALIISTFPPSGPVVSIRAEADVDIIGSKKIE